MAQKQKLDLTTLIKEKTKYKLGEETKTAELNVARLNATVTVEIPDSQLCIDVLSSKDETDVAGIKADSYLVYTIMQEPNLKDKGLQEAYECIEPTDIVGKIFTIGEISDIAEFALNEAGFKRGTVSGKVIEQIKN